MVYVGKEVVAVAAAVAGMAPKTALEKVLDFVLGHEIALMRTMPCFLLKNPTQNPWTH